jgi:hypothetical protein
MYVGAHVGIACVPDSPQDRLRAFIEISLARTLLSKSSNPAGGMSREAPRNAVHQTARRRRRVLVRRRKGGRWLHVSRPAPSPMKASSHAARLLVNAGVRPFRATNRSLTQHTFQPAVMSPNSTTPASLRNRGHFPALPASNGHSPRRMKHVRCKAQRLPGITWHPAGPGSRKRIACYCWFQCDNRIPNTQIHRRSMGRQSPILRLRNSTESFP